MSSVHDTISSVEDTLHSMQDTVREAIADEPRTAAKAAHREGKIARSIEQQTAKIPSDAFLWSALGSIGAALALRMMGKESAANFVGHWASTFLVLGMYNKLVKLHGSDGV